MKRVSEGHDFPLPPGMRWARTTCVICGGPTVVVAIAEGDDVLDGYCRRHLVLGGRDAIKEAKKE
jgi:hypothetical protein